jgi:hypothetical protein
MTFQAPLSLLCVNIETHHADLAFHKQDFFPESSQSSYISLPPSGFITTYLSCCQQRSGNVGNKLTLPSACFMMLVLKEAIEKSWRGGVGEEVRL